MSNRLRTEGTDHLLAAGRAVGHGAFVAQSIAAPRFTRTGAPVQAGPIPSIPTRRRRFGRGSRRSSMWSKR
jgi:hypothetical protein